MGKMKNHYLDTVQDLYQDIPEYMQKLMEIVQHQEISMIHMSRRWGKSTMHSLQEILRLNNMKELVGKFVKVRKNGSNYLVKVEDFKGFTLTGIIQENKPECNILTFHFNNISEILPEGDWETLKLLYGESNE